MRRADRAAGQDHLDQRVGALDSPAALELDPDRAVAVEHDPAHQRVGDDLDVGPPHRRAEIGARRALPAAAAPGLLHPADIGAGAGRQVVDVLVVFEADLGAGLDQLLAQRRFVRGARGQERPAGAVELVLAALPVLGPLEIGQYVVPRPAAVAELAPMIEILGLAAHVDHAVDRAGAAQHLAAGIKDRAVVDAGIGLGDVAPGQGLVVEQFDVAGRDVDQRVAVGPARLDQHDPGRRVLRQPVGQDAAGGAGADDNVIRLHASPLAHSAPGVFNAKGRL